MSRRKRFAGGSWLAALAVGTVIACGGSRGPDQADTALLVDPPGAAAVPLAFRPDYVSLSQSSEAVHVYLEYAGAQGLEGHGLLLEPSGRLRSSLERLAVGFGEPFGDPVTVSTDLLVAVVRRADEGVTDWELWSWRHPEPPEQLLACTLPAVVRGQVLAGPDELYVLFETTTGELWGFRTLLEEPACPAQAETTRLASALPDDYRLEWLDGRIVLGSQSGDSYSLRFYGPHLELLRRIRLASGAVPETAELFVDNLPGTGSVAVYAARVDGAWDLYLSELDQLAVGPLPSTRIVASAEEEREPRLFRLGDGALISWTVLDEGHRLELAGLLPSFAVALPGGEVLWRYPAGSGALYRSLWTAAGLLRVWVEPRDATDTLHISMYRPSFWPRAAGQY